MELTDIEIHVLYKALRHWRKTAYHESEEEYQASYSIEDKFTNMKEIK